MRELCLRLTGAAMTRRLLFVCLLCGLGLSTLLDPARAADVRPEDIVERYGKAVALIVTSDAGGGGSQGTGFFLSADGVLLTSLHVLRNATSASIQLTDGTRSEEVVVLDYSLEHDLALVRVGRVRPVAVQLGDPARMKVGARVYVLGNPRGLTNTITDGLLSAVRTEEPRSQRLQISAPISSGSSGSPVFNAAGQVIGIAAATIEGGQNLNLAVPISYAAKLKPTERIALADLEGHILRGMTRRAKHVLAAHTGPVLSVDWHPDGRTVASSGTDNSIRLWDVASWTVRLRLPGHPADRFGFSTIGNVRWSPDGTCLASTGATGTLRLNASDTGDLLREWQASRTLIAGLGWSPDGRRIVTTDFRPEVVANVWDSRTGQKSLSIRGEDNLSQLAWSPDGRSIAGGAGHNVLLVWGSMTGARLHEMSAVTHLKVMVFGHEVFADRTAAVTWSPGGELLAAGYIDGALRLWRPGMATALASQPAHRMVSLHHEPDLPSSQFGIMALSWHPGGRFLATAGADGDILIWDAATLEKRRVLTGHAPMHTQEGRLAGGVRDLAWSPDGGQLVSAGGDGTVRAWEFSASQND